ncbi:3601_t:CDS:1, partial [Acaulospora morrowiae]
MSTNVEAGFGKFVKKASKGAKGVAKGYIMVEGIGSIVNRILGDD